MVKIKEMFKKGKFIGVKIDGRLYKANKEGKLTWDSVYEAPNEYIIKSLKKINHRKPTHDELNDIILSGEFY